MVIVARSSGERCKMNEKSYLIVTGVARSGTTAMADLLNAHPHICLGIERFKFQYLRRNNYATELFTRERFFDFRPEDTNLLPDLRPHWKGTYDAIEEKWDTALVIGDKVPDLFPVLPDFLMANPDYRYICILRNLKDVALSWQARADRPRDSWPVGKGFAMACESWAEQYRLLHDLMADRTLRRRIMILDHDRMYQEPDQTEAAILNFIGLAPDDRFREVLAQQADFVRNRADRKVPAKFVEAYKAVDMGHARGLRKIARDQAEKWAAASGQSPRH
jgi:Sulfotransferase family